MFSKFHSKTGKDRVYQAQESQEALVEGLAHLHLRVSKGRVECSAMEWALAVASACQRPLVVVVI